MAFDFDSVKHHQRFLITGSRASEITDLVTEVLKSKNRPFDLLVDGESNISDAPMALIIHEDFEAVQPHIALIDEVSENNKSAYESLAASMPKSGTLVYNESNALAKEICTKERQDVHQVPYQQGDAKLAAIALSKRIAIRAEDFS